MKSLAIAAVLAISGAVGLGGAAQAALVAGEDKDVKITGCVVKGDGGYVLMPLLEQGGAAAVLPPGGTTGSAVGTAGTPAGYVRVIYWLDDDDVEDHAGRRVEITGEVEDDIDEGEISVEREDDGTVELEFKHEGKTIGVKLPRIPYAVGTGGAITDEEKDYQVAVRKVDVKNVKVLASACQ